MCGVHRKFNGVKKGCDRWWDKSHGLSVSLIWKEGEATLSSSLQYVIVMTSTLFLVHIHQTTHPHTPTKTQALKSRTENMKYWVCSHVHQYPNKKAKSAYSKSVFPLQCLYFNFSTKVVYIDLKMSNLSQKPQYCKLYSTHQMPELFAGCFSIRDKFRVL